MKDLHVITNKQSRSKHQQLIEADSPDSISRMQNLLTGKLFIFTTGYDPPSLNVFDHKLEESSPRGIPVKDRRGLK